MNRILSSALFCLTSVLLGVAASTPARAAVATDKLNTDLMRAFELRNLCPAVTPARIADICVDPNNRSVWYVASAASGVWKTSNRGTTWTPVFDTYGSFSTGCVTVDPKNSSVVWLGTGENQSLRSVSYGDGLYKSTDAGATWKRVGLEKSEHLARILIDPRNSDVVYVAAQGPLWAPGGDRGLYKTTDGGQTWKAVLQITENTGVSDIAFDPRNADVIYAVSYQRRRHVGQLIGGGPDAGVFKSADAGKSWEKLTNGLPTCDLGRMAIAVSPQQPDVVYLQICALAVGAPGFYRSADAGKTWERQSDYRIQDPQFYGELYPDPHHFDTVYVIDTVIGYTTNGGKNIQRVNWGGGIHVDNHAMVFDPTDANHLLVGNDGGMYETYDNGRTFRRFDNMAMQQFYAASVDNAVPFYYVYGGAQDNGSLGAPSRTVYRAGIRNSDWVIVGGGDGMQPRVDTSDPNILYVQSQNGAVNRLDLRTSAATGIRPPRGSNETPRWNWNTPIIVSPHSSSRIYFAGNRVYRSENRGTNWQVISPDISRQLNRDTLPVMGKVWTTNAVSRNTYTTDLGVTTALCESPRKEGLLYVGTDDGLVQVSEDGGANWRKIEKFPGVAEMAMVSDLYASPIDTDTVFASFNDYQRGNFKPYLLKSTNRGRDWTPIMSNLPENYPVWSVVQDTVNPDLLFAGTEFGLFVTIDGGKQWTQLREGAATAAFRDLEIQQRETDLVCATFGRGFYILDDYSALRYLKPETLAKDAALFPLRKGTRVYHEETLTRASAGNIAMPNPPFGAMFTYFLKQDLAGESNRVTLAVSDASDKVIRQVTGPGTAGFHRVNWNLFADAVNTNRPAEIIENAGDQQTEEMEEEEEEAEPQSATNQELQQETGRGDNRGDNRGDAADARGGRAGGRGGFGRGGRGGGRGGGNSGVLVTPGKYKVTLGRMVDGKLVPLAEPQTFEVIPLEAVPVVGSARTGAK